MLFSAKVAFLLLSLTPADSMASIAAKLPAPRSYDVVVLGSTGFTGALVAEYISKNYPSRTGLRWAIAGRDEKKLKLLKSKLSLDDSVGILIANSENQNSLDTLASQTKVVISTAGPFAKIGTPVVDACVRTGTHYCDITGEAPWIRDMIDKYHRTASEKKLRIVNCCGFDCIPADLGAQMISDEMKKKKLEPIEIRFICRESKGGVSGGTIASVMNIFSTATPQSLKLAGDPYYLTQRDSSGSTTQATDLSVTKANRDTAGFFYDKIEGKWMSPWIMQSIDTRIVHRSNSLSNWQYGRNIIYREVQASSGYFSALSASAVGSLVGPLLFFSSSRNIINSYLPKQGEGPSQDLLDNGFMNIGFWGLGRDARGKEVVVKGKVSASGGDPGYRQTAKFVAEAGISLANDETSLPQNYGVLTPSTAMGNVLTDRLRLKGVDFSMEK